MSLPSPPLVPGLPLLGNLLEYLREPISLFLRGYKECGPIFSIRLGPKCAVVLIGPENNQFFFEETDNYLSRYEAHKWFIPMFGDKFPLVAKVEDYQKHLPIYTFPFRGKNLHGYLEAMVYETMNWLDNLGENGEFELINSFGHLTLFISARAILGLEIRECLGKELWYLFKKLSQGSHSHLTRNLRLPRYQRYRAKLRFHSLIKQVIAERRARSTNHEDFLQSLLRASYANGESAHDQLIINLVLGLFWASFPTTMGHVSWALIQLLQNPNYLARVLSEIDEVLRNGSQIDLNALSKLSCLEWALKETERMRPAVLLIGRYTAKPYDLGGYHIPKGWVTIVSPALSHRLSEVFLDPNKYDPDRFSPQRAEDRKTPFSLIGFGGGMHSCLGKQFAYNEMKVILSLLLQRYKLELVDPDPKPESGPNPNWPKGPIMVRYRRRI